MLKNIRNAITRVPMDRLGSNLGGRIPSCSRYWKCHNSSYDGTDWDESWVVASKQHLCCKTVSLVLVVTANRDFDENWMTVPLWYKKNNLIW